MEGKYAPFHILQETVFASVASWITELSYHFYSPFTCSTFSSTFLSLSLNPIVLFYFNNAMSSRKIRYQISFFEGSEEYG